MIIIYAASKEESKKQELEKLCHKGIANSRKTDVIARPSQWISKLSKAKKPQQPWRQHRIESKSQDKLLPIVESVLRQ